MPLSCAAPTARAERPYRVALGLLLLAFAAVRIPYQRRARHNAGLVIHREHDQHLAVHSVMLLAICAVARGYLRDAPWVRRFMLPLPVAARWGGVFVAGMGLALVWRSHAALEENFSAHLDIRAHHTLTRVGPYRLVRHPMYSGFLLLVVGGGLLSSNGLLLVTPLAAVGGVIARRVGKEEDQLREAFGEEYQAYMLWTGRFLPHLAAMFRQPEGVS